MSEEHTNNLMQQSESLIPELREHLHQDSNGGLWVKHRYVVTIYVPGSNPLNAMTNRTYHQRAAAAKRLLGERQWDHYMFMIEKPFLLDCFVEIEPGLPDEDYWRLLGSIWQRTEFIASDLTVWSRLWRSDRKGREHAMDEGERKALAEMPDTLHIYRGIDRRTKKAKRRLAWTLDRKTAEWFSTRMETGYSTVLSGHCQRSDVLAYFTGRNETEIVIPPEMVVLE